MDDVVVQLPSEVPALLTNTVRDDDRLNHQAIQDQINHYRHQVAVAEVPFQQLPQIYDLDKILYYDSVTLGSAVHADLLASQIPSDFRASSYLDLGCGSGNTALACGKVLRASGTSCNIVVMDGMKLMCDNTHNKLKQLRTGGSHLITIAAAQGNAFHDSLYNLPRQLGGQFFSLITAQKVLLGARQADRARVLRHWAAILHPSGKLIVDVTHPDCSVAGFFVGLAASSTLDERPIWERFFRLADDETFEECRRYAEVLANQAQLRITNAMPAQLPTVVEDGTAAQTAWVQNRRANTLTGNLSRDECVHFTRRYAAASEDYYHEADFKCEIEIAAVIVVFEHMPTAASTATNPAPPAQPSSSAYKSTRYDVDPSLTGKARKNAKDKAAKKAKKAEENTKGKGKGKAEEEGEDNGGDDEGAASASICT